MATITPQEPVFLNVETIFSWLYTHIFGGLFTLEAFRALQVIATILVILLIALIFYCLVRLYEFKQEDKKKALAATSPAPASAASPVPLPSSPSVGVPSDNHAWQSVRGKLLSDSPSDWRLGIIEADIYLDKVLDSKNFFGDTLGDKLKNITPDQLPSIQIAWEAHKVRNRIAHDGADFTLTMPEARRVLSYFEIVFRDLGVIE